MRLEKHIEGEACRQVLVRFRVRSVKFTPAGVRGYPDRFFWIPGGRPLLIEFKRPGFPLEPLQVHRHEELKELGYDVETHETVEGAVRAVRRAVARALRR